MKAKQILNENRSILDSCANLLIEKEKISREEFESLFPEGAAPKKEEPGNEGLRIAPGEEFE